MILQLGAVRACLTLLLFRLEKKCVNLEEAKTFFFFFFSISHPRPWGELSLSRQQPNHHMTSSHVNYTLNHRLKATQHEFLCACTTLLADLERAWALSATCRLIVTRRNKSITLHGADNGATMATSWKGQVKTRDFNSETTGKQNSLLASNHLNTYSWESEYF